MGSLSSRERDVQALVALTVPYPDDGGPLLPWALLRDLKDLVPCDWLEASFQDTPRWEITDQPFMPMENASGPSEDFQALYRTLYWSSSCSYPDRSGDTSAVFRNTDLDSERQLRNKPMFVELYRPAGIERELFVCLSAGAPGRTVRLLFSRGPGADFTDQQVAMMTLLQPHLQRAYDRAQRRRSAAVHITDRQNQVMALVAQGCTDQQIARRLAISPATVSKHLENVYARLGVAGRVAAVMQLNNTSSA